MTGQGVERTPRTAYPSSLGPPAGSSTLMPPPSQGAERRSERRDRRTRWGLRVLVVGGLAGAAWLLTGAAAQAADRTDGPTGSLFGSVVGGDATSPGTGLLTAADQPLEADFPAHEHLPRAHRQWQGTAGILDVPRRVLDRPETALTEVTSGQTGSVADAALGTVDQALPEVAAPVRLTGGAAITSHLLTAADPVDDVARPIAGRQVDDQPAATPAAGPARKPVISEVRPAPVAVRRPTARVPQARTVHVRSAHRHRTASSVEPAREAATDVTPGDDGPAAPLQQHLGDGSGTPAGGSGTPTGGGAPAFLPAAIADSTTACRRLPIAEDVEDWRCYDAEEPTVSPD